MLTLGVGGAAVYLIQKPANGGGSTAAIAFLPADTVLLAAIPDLNKTAADWKTTDLYKIWSEPDVQAFLAKPLSKVPPHPALDNALAKADKLGLTNLFVALTSLDEGTNEPRLVAGFQFKGKSADVDELLAVPKAELRKQHPASKADLINYEGHAIETVILDEHSTLASVYLGDWYLISNDLTLLKTTIDRAEHRGPAAGQPTLDNDADYLAVTAKLPASRSTLIFGRPKSFMAKIYDLAEASGQPVDTKQRAEADKVKAIGASTGFEGGKMRDTIYIFAPGISQDLAKLGMDSLPLTTADTVFYASSMLNIPEKFELPDNGADGARPAGLAFLQGFGALLNEHGITLASFRAAFNNEGSVHIDWPAGQPQPVLIASLDVRDPAAANQFVDHFTDALSSQGDWETTDEDGLTLHSLNLLNAGSLAPTLTVTPKHLLFGLNAPDVQDAAKREKTPALNFTASGTYKSAAGQVAKPNTAFAYLDSKAFFERFYGTLKPYAVTASFLMPKVNDYVDLGKLPEPEVISRHLSPTVLSQTYSPDGCLLESVGSFTFAQATVAVIGGAAGAAVPFMPKTHGDQVRSARPATPLATP